MLYLKRNRGIFKNFTLTRLTPILFFLFGASPIGSLLAPSFNRIQSLISVVLNSDITLLVRAVCFPSPHEENIDCVTGLRNVFVGGKELELLFYGKPAFRFPQFYLSKAVLYTQSVVRVLYLVRVLYPVRSPWSAVRSRILY